MDSPDAPPFSARPVALPYMGIKRTAPRDWSRPGTSRRPLPNAFQTVNGISSRRRRRDVLPSPPSTPLNHDQKSQPTVTAAAARSGGAVQ